MLILSVFDIYNSIAATKRPPLFPPSQEGDEGEVKKLTKTCPRENGEGGKEVFTQ